LHRVPADLADQAMLDGVRLQCVHSGAEVEFAEVGARRALA
jgi:hypothetical protein